MKFGSLILALGIMALPAAAGGGDAPAARRFADICGHPSGPSIAQRLTVAISYQDATPQFVDFAGRMNLALINWWRQQGKQSTDGIWCVPRAPATTDAPTDEPRAGIVVYGLLGNKSMLSKPAVFSVSLMKNRAAAANIAFAGIRGTLERATAEHAPVKR